MNLDGPAWTTCETFGEGRALFSAVCELGFEGMGAKNRSSLYRRGERAWVKVDNLNYWRRDDEREALARSRERRHRTLVWRTCLPVLGNLLGSGKGSMGEEMEPSGSQRADVQPAPVDSACERGFDWPLAVAIIASVLALYFAIGVGLFWLVAVTS